MALLGARCTPPAELSTAARSRRGAARLRLSVAAHAEAEAEPGFDPRAFRRALGQSSNYSRKHQRDEDAAKEMEEQGVGAVSQGAPIAAAPREAPSHARAGGLIARMKTEGYTHTRGDVTLQLAQSYGFCWGVERAVQMAYEARAQYPTQKMWITNEIIHNPSVNQARGASGARRAG